MKVTLILAALLTFFANLAYTQEYELVLTEAVDAGSNGRFPLHVFMRADGDTLDDAVLWSIPREFSGTVDVSGLSLVDGVIQGTLAATVNEQEIQAAITVHDQGAGILRGQYRDGERSPSLVRSVEGRVRSALDTSAPSRASLVLQHPSVGPVFLNIEHDGSDVQSVTLQTIRLRNTGYGSSFNPSQMAFINSDGVQAAQLGNIDDLQPVAAVSHDLTLDADGLRGRVSLDLNPGGGSTRLHYDLETSMIAGYLFGNVTIRDAAENSVGVPQSAAGHIAAPQPALPIPELTPMVAAPAQAGTAFAPPYFENISQEAFANRVRAAALWLGQSSYVGGYHSDFFANLVTATGSKQYDNASENTYGAVMAHLMLARLSEDPAAREAALRAAQRAGHWGQALGTGPYNMLEPYKALFYTTIGQGWAFLELYQQTGDAQWLANARRHADGLRELQVLMSDGIIEQVSSRGGNAIAGTWTYFTPTGEYRMGESDSRTNRTRDFEPIQCGQILIFLGRLRVESGIDDYLEMEQAAAHWMSANLEDDWTWETKPQAGYGPASYLYYLLHYAENPSEADIDQVLAHIETQHTSWAHNANTMSPGVAIDINRRQGVTDLDASVSLRVALCYLELHTRRGDAVYLAKAKALIHSALSRQNNFGYLQSGGRIFSDPAAADSFPARYAEDPNHPYTMYNALTVDLLHRCYQALARMEVFADGAVVAADLTVDYTGGLAPLTVVFDASASIGSSLTYHWDFGDGTQGSGATPSHQFSHPGNYLVQLTVRSGDVADHRSVIIRVREAQGLTSIAVSPVERLYWQNPWDFNDSMEYLQVDEQRAYQATAYDQYGTRLAIQPGFTWSTNGENTVTQDGLLRAQPLPGQTFIFQLEASAAVDGHSVSGTQPYRVLGNPAPGYQGFSVNFHTSGGGSSPVDHPAYTAGVIALDQWGNQGRNTWGGGSSFETTFSDNAHSATLRLSSGRANAAGNAATSPPNADVLISAQRLVLRDEGGLILSEIPQSYRDAGYHLYVYSHRSDASAHSIRLQIGDGEAETVWLKGTNGAWDGLTYTPATAVSEAEALAGGFTNVVIRSNLSAETIHLHASFGITAIQLIQARMDEGPLAFASRALDGAAVGVPYSYAVQLRGGDAETLVLSAVDLPDWLELMPDPEDPRRGTLFGTPGEADEGPHAILLAAADADGEVSQAFTLTVFPEGFVLEAPMILPLAPAAIGLNAATLRANLTRGEDPVEVRLLRGTFDGGDSPMAWQLISSPVVHGLGELEWELEGLQPGTTYYYRFSAQNAYGLFFTETQSFTTEASPARVVQQPTNAESFPGGQAQFSVIAAGVEPITYQWRKNGVDLADGTRISGANSSVLIISDLTAEDAGSYTVFVSNNDGSDLSEPATLTLIDPVPPVITTQPVGGTFEPGATVELFVEVESLAPVAFQWRRNGVPLSEGGGVSGVDTATLLVSSFGTENEGSYDVVVSSVGGSTVSDPASVFLLPSMDAILAEWNFNHFPESTTTEGFEETIAPDFGIGVLYVRSSSSTGTNFRRSTGGGTELNASDGTPAGGTIELRRGSRWNNGLVEIRFDMTGFEAALVSFAYRTSDSLPSMAVVEWSADGGETYTEHNVLTSADYEGGFAVVWLDLTEATALNNAADARVRLRYNADGGSTSAGSGAIFDNVRVEARRSAVGYAEWRAARFGDTEHPDGEPRADPWQRGIPNILDYVLGLDHLESPHNGLPRSGVGTLHFTRRADAEFLLLVEESHDLAPDSWEIIAFLEPGSNTWTAIAERSVVTEVADGPVYLVTVSPTSPLSPALRRFWRVTVETP